MCIAQARHKYSAAAVDDLRTRWRLDGSCRYIRNPVSDRENMAIAQPAVNPIEDADIIEEHGYGPLLLRCSN